jgi:chromosome partitioning protein
LPFALSYDSLKTIANFYGIKAVHVIVIGNEKGGSGKTTTAMHLIIGLLELGFKVGSFDLDCRQQSLSRYVSNRKDYVKTKGRELLMPEHVSLTASVNDNKEVALQEDEAHFANAFNALAQETDFLIIDTPGSDSNYSRIAHSYADTVITPINDSFIDLDLIGNVSAENLDSIRPGIYSAMLWEAKMKRAALSKAEQNWFVVRNRLSQLDAHNKRNMEISIQKLAKRFGFKIAPGFGDRVIFKELFLNGLTLHDAFTSQEIKVNPSVVAARMELRAFMKALDVKAIDVKLNEKEVSAA